MKTTSKILTFMLLPLLSGCYYKTDLVSDVRQEPVAIEADSSTAGMHQVHYRAIVSNGQSTRTSLSPQNKYVFSSGDYLYVKGTGDNASKFYGFMEIQTDSGEAPAEAMLAEGDLWVADGFEPDDDMEVGAVLVGADDMVHELTRDGSSIKSTSYPADDALATTLTEAVERYSDMKATGTYGDMSFHLEQDACFVKFSVTLDDDTPADTDIPVYVWTNSADMEVNVARTGTVTTVDDDGIVKAEFVVAYPGGTTLSNALVGLGMRTPIAFCSTPAVLEANKVYTVTRNFMREEGAIGFAHSTLIKSCPDMAFINDLTNTGDGVVTYSSSDTDVATVDPATGEVTVTGAGMTTITATVADGVNYVYDDAERTASYLVVAYAPVALSVAEPSQLGWVVGSDGKAYVSKTGAQAAGHTPVAVIGYVGEAGQADASSASYHGLAIALTDATIGASTSLKWSDVLQSCTTNACNRWALAKVALTGIENSTRLGVSAPACRAPYDPDDPDEHVHPAAQAAYSYTVAGFTPTDHGYSGWFLPSTGQWYLVLESCGVATYNWAGFSYCPDSDGSTTNRAANYIAVQQLMSAGESSLTASRYWTSTEYNANNALSIGFSSTNGVQMTSARKTLSGNVRAFFAF